MKTASAGFYAVWLHVSTFASAQDSDSYSDDYLTLRYHGQLADANPTRQDIHHACNVNVAVCANLRLNECVKAPKEMRAPYNRNITDYQSSRYVFDPPNERQASYLLLARVESRTIHDSDSGVPTNVFAHSEGLLRLFSGCQKGCADCYASTGLVLDNVEPGLPLTCGVTAEAGLFALVHWPTYQSDINCVDSLTGFYAELDEASVRDALIRVLIGFGFALFLMGGIAYWLWLRKRGGQAGRLDAHDPNRINHNSFAAVDAQGENRVTIDLDIIERQFPPAVLTEDMQCIVCLQDVRDTMGRELQCGHKFHSDCILTWWKHRRLQEISCPVCRQQQRIQTGAASTATNGAASPEVIGASDTSVTV